MEGCCNLEVEVNGRETFMVNMETIESYSGRFRKLLGRKKMTKTSKMKVILHDFPGGADGFQLMARFCYTNGKIQITPYNIVLLNSVATFMEMDSNSNSVSPNLIQQTENSLKGISYWSWSELLSALKQCQQLLPASHMVDKIVDSLVQRLSLPSIAASRTSSSDSSCHRLSTDTATNDSKKIDSSKCWFEDLVFLSVDWIEGIVKKMLGSTEFEHSTVSRFIAYYQKARFLRAESEPEEKQKILESMIDLFSLLDRSSVSCKCLFQIFHLCWVLKMSNKYMTALESLIGSKLDQGTVNQLLFPSPIGDRYAYDVNLVLRIVEAFLRDKKLSLVRLRKVGLLMDSYSEEVGPDSNLNPSKFAELVSILPDAARDCHDRLYKSIDLYFETHRKLCGEDRLRICSVLTCTKLSTDAVKNLARNSRFPSRFRAAAVGKCNKEETVRAHVDRFQEKVVEMEKAYKTMANLMKSPTLLSPRNDRYFPKLCST